MDIISIFESGLEEKDGEKLFRARIIMQAFGYNKWERFEGAIQRTLTSLSDERSKENFFPVEIKTTGGRPSRDYMITRGGCYLLLKFCDSRKQEVQDLKIYLEKLYLNSKIQTQTLTQAKKNKKFLTKEFVFLLILFFGFLATLMYYSNVFQFMKNQSGEFYVSPEQFPATEVVEIEQKYLDEENRWETEKEIENFYEFNNNSEENQTNSKLDEYLQSNSGNVSVFDTTQNPRNSFTKNLEGTDLISSYFLLGNAKRFQDSCSLLEKSDCNALSKNLSSFANFWEKTSAGYDVIEVKEVQDGKYCVKYKYNLKNDRSDNFITETFQYQTSYKNGVEQITGRYCEKIEKNGRERPCPFVLKEYVCEE